MTTRIRNVISRNELFMLVRVLWKISHVINRSACAGEKRRGVENNARFKRHQYFLRFTLLNLFVFKLLNLRVYDTDIRLTSAPSMQYLLFCSTLILLYYEVNPKALFPLTQIPANTEVNSLVSCCCCLLYFE